MEASCGTSALGDSLAAIQDERDAITLNCRVPMEQMGIHHQDGTQLDIEGDAVAGNH